MNKESNEIDELNKYAKIILNNEYEYKTELNIEDNSYVFIVKCTSNETSRLNNEFIDLLLTNNKIDLLSGDMTFRFQTDDCMEE